VMAAIPHIDLMNHDHRTVLSVAFEASVGGYVARTGPLAIPAGAEILLNYGDDLRCVGQFFNNWGFVPSGGSKRCKPSTANVYFEEAAAQRKARAKGLFDGADDEEDEAPKDELR